VLPASSEKDASIWQRAITSSARIVVLPAVDTEF